MSPRLLVSIAIAIAIAIASSSTACGGARTPVAPSSSSPYEVRLLGAADGALRGRLRNGQSVFVGAAGHDYAVEIANGSTSEVGVSMLIDGLDAMSGEPVLACGNEMWLLEPDSRGRIRGFTVSETRIATYRFARPAQALAAIVKGGHQEAIGTIEVCFFALQPAERSPLDDEGLDGPPARFDAIIENDAGGLPPAASPIAGEVREQPAAPVRADVVAGRRLARVVVAYEDADGAPLGTAPPPDGIARVARPRAEERPAPRAPAEDVPMPPNRPVKAPKAPVKPQKAPAKTPKPDVKG